MYGVLLGLIFLDYFTSGNWRAMMLLSSLPNVFVFIWAIFSLHESPRYLIATNQLEKAYEVMNLMIKKNHTSCLTLSNEEVEYLTEEEKI